MEIGILGLPRVPIVEHLPFQATFHLEALRPYYDAVQRHPVGHAVSDRLRADSRYLALEGKMLNQGSGSGRLELTNLAAWYLYRANDVGLQQADKELNSFLDANDIGLLAAIWLYGTTVATRMQIDDEIELVPITEMPASSEKSEFQRGPYHARAHEFPTPQAALVKCIQVRKTAGNETLGGPDPGFLASAKPALNALRELQEIAILLNCVPKVCCLPGYSTCYSLAETPLGPFGGSGGGSPIFDLLPRRSSHINSTELQLISSLVRGFRGLSRNSQLRLQAALHRLAQAKGRINYGDTALDLGIALEMLLLNREHEGQELPGQLTLHFRLRGSWLISETYDERRAIFKSLGKIYSLRSQIAHNGFSEELNKMEHAKREAMLAEHTAICERIIQRLIFGGTPNDWTAVVLGDKQA